MKKLLWNACLMLAGGIALAILLASGGKVSGYPAVRAVSEEPGPLPTHQPFPTPQYPREPWYGMVTWRDGTVSTFRDVASVMDSTWARVDEQTFQRWVGERLVGGLVDADAYPEMVICTEANLTFSDVEDGVRLVVTLPPPREAPIGAAMPVTGVIIGAHCPNGVCRLEAYWVDREQ